jgi:hypothetical protein
MGSGPGGLGFPKGMGRWVPLIPPRCWNTTGSWQLQATAVLGARTVCTLSVWRTVGGCDLHCSCMSLKESISILTVPGRYLGGVAGALERLWILCRSRVVQHITEPKQQLHSWQWTAQRMGHLVRAHGPGGFPGHTPGSPDRSYQAQA